MTVGVGLRLVLTMALWAACFPLITLGIGSAPHLAFAAIRAFIAGICLVGLGSLLGRPLPIGGHRWGLLVLAGLGSTTLGLLGMFHAAEFVAPGIATVIANGQPLLGAILAHIFLAERLGRTGGLGLISGFAGIIVIAWPGAESSASGSYALGIGYIALAAAGVSVGNVAMKRLAGEVDAFMAMGIQLLVGGIPLAFLSIATEDISAVVWSAQFVLVLVTLAVLGTAVAFWLWFRALEETGLNRANAFTFLVPVFGLAAGAVFFEERFGWSAAMGGTLVIAGIVLVQRDAYARTTSITERAGSRPGAQVPR